MSLRTGKSALSCFVIKLSKPSLLINSRISLMPVFKGPLFYHKNEMLEQRLSKWEKINLLR